MTKRDLSFYWGHSLFITFVVTWSLYELYKAWG
jgi:hypothetical protein